MTTYREGLLAAARVCESIWREQNKEWLRTGLSYHDGGVDAAEECERAILALAEQEDQWGAAALQPYHGVSFESPSAGTTGPQSAPHPDPAGQTLRATGDSESGTSPQSALPGPDMVSVPRDALEGFIRMVEKQLGKPDRGDITPARMVELARAMLAAGSAK